MPIFHMLTDFCGKAIMLSLSLLLVSVHTDCDPEHPDTAANRNAFRTFTGISPENVSNVYFLADEGFVDESYFLAFCAPRELIEKIIRKYDLKRCSDTEYKGLDTAYHWWEPSERKKGIFYQATRKDETGNIKENHALWYDPETGKAQFSMIVL